MAIRVGPMIPGLGVNYVSPAVAARENAINIRNTGASAGEANRFAQMAPKGTTTKPVSANSALGLGEQARPIVPSSISRPATPSATLGGTPGETNRFTNIQSPVTSTGALRPQPEAAAQLPGAGSSEPGLPETGTGGGGGTGGSTGGSTPAPAPAPAAAPVAEEAGASPIDAAAALDAAINQLLDPEFIGFQGDRASELRRLQNLRNQLFGDAEFGQTGSVQRQQELDANSRRRLAAQRAMSGMLQGGAYAGTERGLGTMQRANQDFALQEMTRPFREATAADRLREFGLSFDPSSRVFDQMDMDLTGFTTQTQAGREAAARARLAAIQQLAQQGITI